MLAKSKSKGKGKARLIDNNDSDVDFSTQGFVAHESDQEQLWNVVEIRGERKGMYLIQWEGADENGNPWEDSWVPREDVTDDLVEVWKEKKRTEKKDKAKKKAEKRERKRQGCEYLLSLHVYSPHSLLLAFVSVYNFDYSILFRLVSFCDGHYIEKPDGL